jgi:hypothetical protein
MGDVKNDVQPNDDYAANYLVWNAVNIFVLPSSGSCANPRPTLCRRRSDAARADTIGQVIEKRYSLIWPPPLRSPLRNSRASTIDISDHLSYQ